ncbi:ribosome recycling factor [Brackiella oedipodis]|uniref:ribosome recycling factor n=1 Tax=Brackiella oedipodis TaxID=124225 RepID=UPI000490D18C
MNSEILKNTESRMNKSIESLKSNLSKIRTGRAHAGLLDQVQVDYYGTLTPISQVASVSVIDARNLNVQPWEKSMVAAIDKAIRESDLGLNPMNMGESIRVPMPALTEERRKDLTKVVKAEGEDAKIAIRSHRREANDSLKKLVKEKEISEDDERRGQDLVQQLTDKFVAQIDELIEAKEKEVMTV